MRSIWNEGIPDEPLWRYFKPERIESVVTSNFLHFASARQFEDRFEGAVAVIPPGLPVDPRYDEPEFEESAFEELRRLTKICCWHRSDYESDAMWKLYAGSRKGVAIRTTTERLRSALLPFRLAPQYGEEVPYWGSVRYVDLHRVRLRASMENRFFYKHRAFEWEREFRITISVRMAEEFAVRVPVLGIDVPIRPDVLIESVHLGPGLSNDECGAVRTACERAGLVCPVVTSTLLGRPRYV